MNDFTKKWWYKAFKNDLFVVKLIRENKMLMCVSPHEGFICKKETFHKIYEKVSEFKLFETRRKKYPCEEILLKTIYYHLTGKQCNLVLCRNFFDRKDYTPTLEEVQQYSNGNCEDRFFMIKRVRRNYSDENRSFLRKHMGIYFNSLK